MYRCRRYLDAFLIGPRRVAHDVIKHHDPGRASQIAQQALTFGVVDPTDLILVVEILQPAPLPYGGKPLPLRGWNRIQPSRIVNHHGTWHHRDVRFGVAGRGVIGIGEQGFVHFAEIVKRSCNVARSSILFVAVLIGAPPPQVDLALIGRRAEQEGPIYTGSILKPIGG
jgi:hypothetical protein